jgi:hypothetical protein
MAISISARATARHARPTMIYLFTRSSRGRHSFNFVCDSFPCDSVHGYFRYADRRGVLRAFNIVLAIADAEAYLGTLDDTIRSLIYDIALFRN